jgi:Protein of unknown function (DUF3793)
MLRDILCIDNISLNHGKISTINIAPTLKRLKASTTVTLCKHDRNIKEHWKKHKQSIMKRLNISAFKLKETDRAVIVLFYQKTLLLDKIRDAENANFLIDFGYNPEESIEESLKILGTRFEESVCPHELGIFLGFPLEDVNEVTSFSLAANLVKNKDS